MLEETLYKKINEIIKYTMDKIGTNFNNISGTKITLTEANIVMYIGDCNAPKSMIDIVKAFNTATSTPTRTVNNLVKKKIVIKQQDKNDKRRVKIQLTEFGENIYKEIIVARDYSVNRILINFSDEEKEIISMLFEKLNLE